jgi:hypothetical protein
VVVSREIPRRLSAVPCAIRSRSALLTAVDPETFAPPPSMHKGSQPRTLFVRPRPGAAS